MPSEQESRSFVPRLMLCLATATLISATAYLCAWLSYRDYFGFHQLGPSATRRSLDLLRQSIAHHQEKTGRLPASLADLDVVRKQEVPVDEAGNPIDSWERPLHYVVQGDRYELYSLGRDGQPGGVWLDADLYAGQPDPVRERLTLWQFATLADRGGGIKLSCLLAGILAFPLCLLGVKREATRRLSVREVLVTHGMTAIFAIWAAIMMSALHLPSGH